MKRKTKTSKKNEDLIEDIELDAEEKALLKSYERGEWKCSKRVKKEVALVEEVAQNFLRKDVL